MVSITSRSAVRGVPAVDLGGVLSLTGGGFCRPGGGGSTIAVQIDDGELRRHDASVDRDRAVWQIIRARDDGTFRADVRLPERHETDPDFTDGSHRLRLQTGTISTGDPARSVRTGEFVVLAGNNGGTLPVPADTPSPVDPVLALVGERGGAVTAARTGSSVRVVVPGVQPGDWVFAYAFRGAAEPDARAHPTTWLQVDADRSVTFDLGGLPSAYAESDPRISVQSRDGTLVGWTQVSALSADLDPMSTSSTPAPTAEPPVSRSPRSLVVLSAAGLLLLGLVSLVVAKRRRRRLLRDLNDF